MYRIGTSHYRSIAEARMAYPWGYDEAIADGTISIGKSALKPGDKLLVNSEGRYIIEVQQ